MFRDRAPPARAHEHPGLPRRPARHRHRVRGGTGQRPEAPGQAAVGRAARHLGRRRRRAGLRRPPGVDGAQDRERRPDGHQGRGLPGPRRRHGAQHGALRRRHRGPHPRRRAAGRRRVPRPVGAARPQARMAEDHGEEPLRPRPRQSRPRDHARTRPRGAARRHHRDRAVGLPEPGQQRPVLPLHLPRRARRRRHGDQRGDEDRRRRRHRGARPHRGQRRRGLGLRRARAGVRARVHHPQALRPPPHPPGGAGRRQGRDGVRRGAAAHRRFRRL